MFSLKRIFTLATCFLATAAMFAQQPLHSWKFGVTAGYNASSYVGEDACSPEWNLRGFNVGARAYYQFMPHAYFGTGLSLVRKGCYRGNDADTPLYLELPITAGYNTKVSRTVGVFVDAGPFVAVGVGGRSKYEVLDMGGHLGHTSFYDEPFFGSSHSDAYRYDVGMTTLLGAQFGNHVQLHVGYDISFTSWSSSSVLHNSSVSAGVTWLF